MSPKITVHETDTYLVPEDVNNDDNRNTCLQIEDREPVSMSFSCILFQVLYKIFLKSRYLK